MIFSKVKIVFPKFHSTFQIRTITRKKLARTIFVNFERNKISFFGLTARNIKKIIMAVFKHNFIVNNFCWKIFLMTLSVFELSLKIRLTDFYLIHSIFDVVFVRIFVTISVL